MTAIVIFAVLANEFWPVLLMSWMMMVALDLIIRGQLVRLKKSSCDLPSYKHYHKHML